MVPEAAGIGRDKGVGAMRALGVVCLMVSSVATAQGTGGGGGGQFDIWMGSLNNANEYACSCAGGASAWATVPGSNQTEFDAHCRNTNCAGTHSNCAGVCDCRDLTQLGPEPDPGAGCFAEFTCNIGLPCGALGACAGTCRANPDGGFGSLCTGVTNPGTPSCQSPQADRDCDGFPDFPNVGGACDAGVGECVTTGVVECSSSAEATCNAVPNPPQPEQCNGLDDDCDGVVDNGCPPLDPGNFCPGTDDVGPPVDLATGNVSIGPINLVTVGTAVGPPLQVSLYYNSKLETPGLVGNGWRINLEQRLVLTSYNVSGN